MSHTTISEPNFISNQEKLKLLQETNELLNINKQSYNKIVFVYSAPKVGSTSIVSSLRLFGINQMIIIHIHDEEMLKVLAHVSDVSINELILYNKYLGKDVYVINVYRSPIERKISAFFEKIGSYHFNNNDENVNTYKLEKVIHRFNNIFPHIAVGDHFMDKYNILIPDKFDYNNKYNLITTNGINYITLRLKDSDYWGNILTNIFGLHIKIIKDYESSNKPIKNLYSRFKQEYKIPSNFLEDEINSKYIKYYYSEMEIQQYYNEWSLKKTGHFVSYTYDQYRLYETITLENVYIDKIQLDHYFDEGCICKACSIKRTETTLKLLSGIPVKERITHNEAKTELIHKRIIKANRINDIISKIPRKSRGKDFTREMVSIVTKKY